MKLLHTVRAASLLAAGLSLQAVLLAQGNPCPEAQFFEAWVDPLDGVDGQGSVNDPASPFQTINRAINELAAERDLAAANGDPVLDGLVHCLPGIYTDFVDGETSVSQGFPIEMQPDIHVQGAGAKECVLRVRPSGGSNTLVLWPLSTGLTYISAQVGVWFREPTEDGLEYSDPPMFDGFTIQGADVQVYLGSEVGRAAGRVSNCVFDMREGGAEQLQGPYFGALVGAIYEGKKMGYTDMDLRLFNNTFLQGVRAASGEVELARETSVAICNTCDPTPPSNLPIPLADPNDIVRGVNDLHIQNNLIRSLDDFPRTAMLGIDQGDTQVVVSSRGNNMPYNTNAFDLNLVGDTSVDPGQTFFSGVWDSVRGFAVPAPTPIVDMGPADPGFVGEYLSDLNGTYVRDARILPDSVVVDMGATPAWGVECGFGLFEAENGRVHLDGRTAEVTSSFINDGDGHGNTRVSGLDIDVGFDEFEEVLLAGSYGNDSKSHHLSYDPLDYTAAGPRVDAAGVRLIQEGTPDRDYFFATPTGFFLSGQLVDFAMYPDPTNTVPTPQDQWVTTGAFTHMPGSVAFATDLIVPGATYEFSGLPAGTTSWLDRYGLLTDIQDGTTFNGGNPAGPFFSAGSNWTNPESGQVHGIHRLRWTITEQNQAPTPQFFTEDMWILRGAQLVTSNLLAEYL